MHGVLRLWECDPLIGEPLKTRPERVSQHDIRRITIKPCHPQQNGNVGRYDQILKPKWANSQPWPDNQTLNQALRHRLHYCHNHRSRYSLGGTPPTSRL